MNWQTPVCTDNFGESIHACRFTGELVRAQDAVVIGATLPNVNARYILAPTQQAQLANKFEKTAFNESEANCNTCKNLQRVTHAKNAAGLLYGKCGLDQQSLVFHPSDPMHMKCYILRTAQ